MTFQYLELSFFVAPSETEFACANEANIVEEKVVVIHRGRCNNKVYYCLSHDVVTWDVDRKVSTAYC